ncbi:MAG: 50S ribosomal protein L29 [Candidatus Yanofskybacteria bacterium RIFCSPHIGHO2_01_FULL_41_21]|uniref:Large ribosomal subunit protein uL29 n=1 Tax=Candidatus Yanofskybacteria bacterium RIFCSPHIGHO2_01_FULL_41_21 TaxID=1802660 RepID=A0A1F8ED14_9BACT|nr:MAG: 50S ribosomal protein L29 [Candidatus Yanofskybacteria bacterium RIFCSPHIGHO2_01_FULL_41_21]
MKHFDINNKTQQELSSSLAEFRTKLVQLEFDRADKKLKDVSQFKKTKKDIARILTCLHQDLGGQAITIK